MFLLQFREMLSVVAKYKRDVFLVHPLRCHVADALQNFLVSEVVLWWPTIRVCHVRNLLC